MIEWKKARKKPVVVAFREVQSKQVIQVMVSCPPSPFPISNWVRGEWVQTHEGELYAIAGLDYIIKGVNGEEYPIKKEIFAKTYDVIEENSP